MTSPSTEQVSPHTLRKVIIAAGIGNFVEWFDFAVYGFLATTIAQQFFPSGDTSAALLKTFAVFAVAFAFRPLGGVFFGMLGDRIGRKRTLAMTILLMAGATTLIGLLPTYAAIGVAAPILLSLIRCAQGFSAGGEYAGACAYLMEHAPSDKRAWYGSFVPVSTFSAFAAAAVVAYALEASLSAEAMGSWGWRLPFLIAAPLGLVGLYLRWKLDETPAFQAVKQEHAVAHSPLKETLRNHGAAICCLGAFVSLTALSFIYVHHLLRDVSASGRRTESGDGVAGVADCADFRGGDLPAGGVVFGSGGASGHGDDGVCVVDCGGVPVVPDGQFRIVRGVGGGGDVAGGGRGVVWSGDGGVVVGDLSDTHSVYGFGDYLQHGVHDLWRYGAVGGDVVDQYHRQQPVAGVLSDCGGGAGVGGRVGVAGDVADFAA